MNSAGNWRGEGPILDLLAAYGLNTLRSMVWATVQARHQIDFDDWQNRSPEDLVTGWQQFHDATVWPTVLRRLSHSREARTLLRILGEHRPTNATMLARCEALLDMLPRLETMTSRIETLRELREATMVQGGGGKGAWPSEDIYIEFRDAAKGLRDDVDKAQESLNFDPAAARPAAVAGLQLFEMARPMIDAYQGRKHELGFLDFDDLLAKAHQLLTAPENATLRHRLSSGIRLLLVDEFQDTDPLQVELVKALCGEPVDGGQAVFRRRL